MPLTTIDVIDTAVKVGLGALISGVTTYIIGRRNHSHDIRKAVLSERLQLLKEASVKFEQGGSQINSACERIVIIRAAKQSNQLEQFLTELPNFIAAFNTLKESRSLYFLAGSRQIGELVGEYGAKQDELRKHFAQYGLDFDHNYINRHFKEAGPLKTEILELLATELQRLEA